MGLERFEQRDFTHGEYTRPVFRAGEGPGVVVIHEVPGVTPKVTAFAERLVDAGFRVAMPSLLGTPGKKFSAPYSVKSIGIACVRKEFATLAANRSSAITTWLRGLARDLHAECGGPGVGALGMCLTGNFALSMMVDPVMMAPVLSQPSLPFPVGAARRRGLHISPEDLAIVKRRAKDDGVSLLGMRFTHDPLCPPERFERLRAELGQQFEGIEIDSGRGNAHGIPRTAHSVVTEDLVDVEGHPTRKALDRVLAFFDERLRGADANTAE